MNMLQTTLAGIELRNPLVLASGIIGTSAKSNKRSSKRYKFQ